ADLYAYFMERGVSLLKDEGIFSYIVANKWMRANYGLPLRRWLKEQCIEAIIDFGDLPVFLGATTYPCIIRIVRRPPQASFQATQVKRLGFNDLGEYVNENSYKVNQLTLDDSGWSLADEATQALLDKLKGKGVPLGEYVGGKIYRGILTGLNEAFVIDAQTRERLIAEDPKSAELIKPFLAGRDIKRYRQPIGDKYLIFTRHGISIDDYPAIKKYLSQFKQRLQPRPKDWKGGAWSGRKPGAYKWYEIQDKINYYEEFEKEKIVYAEIASKGQFTLEKDYKYYDTTAYIITFNDNLMYLIGLLNSKLWTFLFSKESSEIRGGFFRWKRQYLSPLPIRTIDFSDPADVARHDSLVSLVERMLALHKQLQEARTPHEKIALQRQIEATDRQIDALVYELYGLTEEEIRIVEGVQSQAR
ncbi:TaqI-like C-terminal specificity domain-containing protein, partial [Methanothrix sp.]|uniref:TaqI-like C-terminal specificity domain-containing protein n=1 Tax=Methanothrix sp. TaxID=90426 RepID=UPI003C742C4A